MGSRTGGGLAAAFDEMNGTGGGVREPYLSVHQWLQTQKIDDLKRKRGEAEALFRRTGITFAVYGDEAATERLIPFDIIPRILSRRRMAPAGGRHRAARARAQRLHVRHLPPPGDHPRRPRARRADHPELGLRAGDDVRGARPRHLLPHHRHRHRAHRRERVLRARGQHAHALRRLLHAGEPGSDDAHVPGAVRPQPRGARSRTIRTTCA